MRQKCTLYISLEDCLRRRRRRKGKIRALPAGEPSVVVTSEPAVSVDRFI